MAFILLLRALNCLGELLRHDVGARAFGLLFCHDFGCLDGESRPYSPSDIRRNVIDLAEYVTSHYDELDSITEGEFQIGQALPQCLWDPAFIEKLATKNQLTSSCQLLRHDGLVFDAEGYVVPCNAMHQVRLGRIHEDFSDSESFLEFWASREIDSIFSRLRSVLDTRCNSCNVLGRCGGGCASNWLNYSFDDIREYLNTAFLEHRRRIDLSRGC